MKRIGLGFFLWMVIATTVPHVFAKPHTAVTLIYFEGSEEQDGIHLTWGTGSEIDTVAFYLRRSEGADFIDLTELYDENGNLYPGGIIDSEGSPAIGSDYLAIDRGIISGITYTYQLIEIEDDNTVNVLSTILVNSGATATPTLQTINNNPVATATSVQSGSNSTPNPTMTATNSSTSSNLSATNTPFAIRTTTNQGSPAQTTPTAVNSNTVASTTNLQVPDSNTREAQEGGEQAQPTASAYPGEPPTPTSAEVDEDYPGQPPVLLPEETATPYPLSNDSQNETPTPTIIAVIGDNTAEAEDQGDETSASTEPAQSNVSSLSVLWGGFLLALIIFIAAIIGSIMIFVRKSN